MKGFKRNTITIGGVIILILSVITFVFIPAVGGGQAVDKKVLGKWKKKGLENTPDGLFIHQYRTLYTLIEQQGYISDKNQQPQFQQFINRHIAHSAFLAAMVELAAQEEVLQAGFFLPNKSINKALVPFYADANGIYSAKRYEQTPEQQKLIYRKTVINYLTAQRYIEDIFGTYDKKLGLKISAAESAFIKSMAQKERTFSYVVFEESQFPKDKIREYGTAHADLFAEHHLQLITFTAQDEANKILQALQKGELKFEDAIVTHSTKTGTDSTGELYAPYRTTINKTFPESQDLDTVLKLGVDQLSPVVKTQSGYAIVKCTAPITPADFSVAETEDRVFDYMKENERGIIEDYLEKQAQTFVSDAKQQIAADNFARIAAKRNLVVQTTNPLGLNYGNISILPHVTSQSDTAFASAEKNETFFKQLFKLKKGEISEPIILDSSIVVMQLKEETDTTDEAQNAAESSYNQYTSSWYYQYPVTFFSFQQLPWGQQTFIDSILKSPHFTDNFDDAMKYSFQ